LVADGARRKRIRLPAGEYAQVSAICAITIATVRRQAVFQIGRFATECIRALECRASATRVAVHAFCFMPNHLHLLLSPSAEVSIIEFIRDFKGETTHISWRYGHKGALWQRSFFDHFLRSDEDLGRARQYILENPVRAGLVHDASGYPLSGAWGLGAGEDMESSPTGARDLSLASADDGS